MGIWCGPEAAWWIQYYPPLVWLPFVFAYSQVAWFPTLVPSIVLPTGLQVAGFLMALASARFAAWGTRAAFPRSCP